MAMAHIVSNRRLRVGCSVNCAHLDQSFADCQDGIVWHRCTSCGEYLMSYDDLILLTLNGLTLGVALSYRNFNLMYLASVLIALSVIRLNINYQQNIK